MKIAIIGSGISGLTAAHYLAPEHAISVFEAGSTIGGHTATKDIALGGRRYAVDTGFIVYNDWTYPNFIALMNELGVESQPTEMSFSVTDPVTGLEYSGSSLTSLFAQRRNLLSPRFWRMLSDIVRFNKQAIKDLDAGLIHNGEELGSYLNRKKYSRTFIDQYLVAMGSAIWSADTSTMLQFPVEFFVKFFRNHGLLSIGNRPQWRVIKGGSREYLQPLTRSFRDRIFTSTPIDAVHRTEHGVRLSLPGGNFEEFDQVVIATHSDQALQLLENPSPAEREILSALPYQSNDVVLHTDTCLLPRNRRTWSSWNYLLNQNSERATVTYNMNILQGIESPETLCVTLNNSDAINPHKVLGQFKYSHPQFSLAGVRAQQRWSEINGLQNTWYCGAYWHNGFHEDGVNSALRVVKALGGKSETISTQPVKFASA